jgi:hypothetical protein
LVRQSPVRLPRDLPSTPPSRVDLQKRSTLSAMSTDLFIHRAASIKMAEAAKVIENTQRDLNIAFMNELSLFFSGTQNRHRQCAKAGCLFRV